MERPRSRYDTRSRSRDFSGYEEHNRESATEWGEHLSTTLFDESIDTIFRDSSEISRSHPVQSSTNDYLLALSSSVPGADHREMSIDWESRNRDKSEDLYKDMLALLDEPQQQKPASKKPASRRKSALSTNRTTEKKRKAGPPGGPRTLAPIAPKPSSSDLTAPPSLKLLESRLSALAKANKISKIQHHEADSILTSADNFILTHLDDALSELENKASLKNGNNATKKNKLTLLLEIYSSVHAVLAPNNKASVLPRQVSPPPPEHNKKRNDDDIADIIEQKKSRALEVRREGNTDEAISLMREAKNLEHQLLGLNLDEDLVDFPFGELDDVDVPPQATAFLHEDDTLTFM